MWVFTRDGFFSVVWDKYCTRDDLMIRTHCRQDLCRLAKKLWGYCDEARIIEIKHGDYRFRMKIPRGMWSEYLARDALEVDYENVKAQITSREDSLRQEAYFQVWEALYRWQSIMEAREAEDNTRT